MVDSASGQGAKDVTPDQTAMADLFLSGVALFGLALLRRALGQRGRKDPLTQRFRFAVGVAVLLYLGRALNGLTDMGVFRILVLMSAALLPLAILLVTEAMLRQHAPQWVKGFALTGTLIFWVSAFWYSGSIDPIRLVGLLCFQVLGFGICGWLILMRDRAGLSVMENTMILRLGVSLLCFIPLAVGDFLMLFLGLPIQFSPLGVLLMCWLALGLMQGQFSHRATALVIASTIVGGLVTGLVISGILGLESDATMVTTALVLAAMLATGLSHGARSASMQARSRSLLQHVATAELSDPIDFLNRLRTHPMVEAAIIVRDENLQGLDPEILDRIFQQTPILRRIDLPKGQGSITDDHIAHLFDRFDASHILQISEDPRILVALSMSALNVSAYAELELQVAQRLALLISQKATKTGAEESAP